MRPIGTLLGIALAVVTSGGATTCTAQTGNDAHRPLKKTFLSDPSIFPIAVWLQNPSRAPQYQKIGINLYVGLWKGPTQTHLAELNKHGMKVICAQNAVGLE